MFNTMNTVRPRPYPQRGAGYNAGNDAADKDGHNSNGQQQQQQGQNPQVLARGRVEDVQQAPMQNRQAINAPANNAYPQAQGYHQTPQMRPAQPMPHHQVNPQQYQTIQSSYQPIQQQPVAQETSRPMGQRSNKVNIAQILKDFKNKY